MASSPTVAMQSIMMGLTIAAKEKRNIAVADIKGAYLRQKNMSITEEGSPSDSTRHCTDACRVHDYGTTR